jgi:hypothetical protein
MTFRSWFRPRLETLEARELPSGITRLQNLGTQTAQALQDTLRITVPARGVATGTTVIVEIATFNINRTVNGATIQSVRDSAGNDYVRDAAVRSNDLQTLVFSAPVVHALRGGSKITIALQAAGPNDNVTVAGATEFSSLLSVDRTRTALGSGTTAFSGPALATRQAPELLVGAIGDVGAGTSLGATPVLRFTPGPGYTPLPSAHVLDSFVNLTLNPEFRAVAHRGAYQADGSFTGGGLFGPVRGWTAALVTFRVSQMTR